MAPNEDNAPGSTELDELVFAYLESTEVRPLEAPALLERLCAEHPTLALDLQRRVKALVGLGLWKPVEPTPGSMPERLGDYRILRRLGEGGMGVVFLAEQESVARRVALKIIRSAELFSPDSRERFLREAQAIARLDHPGIVQVLTVGDAEGLPYFAMEFVAGAPLDKLIDGLRTTDRRSRRGIDVRRIVAERLEVTSKSEIVEWNDAFFERGWIEIALGLVRDIGHALHHAHQRGVLHRDVKPSNVILTPSGRVKLLDFGLASLSDAQSITHSGAQIGSLPYMSPEQIDGRTREIAATSDVYSLGVLLYELLSFTLPYEGSTYEELRRNVLDARLPALRERNPAVPADVETVCAKALDRDAARRYASAADFARDIENILQLRPIVARPPSTVRRVVRWTQRRPAFATAIALGTLLLAVGPLGYELNRQRTLGEVRAAYDRSERDFRSALSAIGHVLRDMANEEMEDVPRMQRVRLVAIDRALELFQSLSAERPDDAQVLAEGGELHRSRGDVLRDLGQPVEALAEFELAIEFQRRALVLSDAPEPKAALAATLHDAGKAVHALWRIEESAAYFEESARLLEAASLARPENLKWRTQSVSLLLGRVEAQRLSAETADRDALLEQARARSELLRTEAPEDSSVAWTAGRTYGECGHAAEARGELDRALEWHQKALAAFEAAAALSSESRFFGFDVVDELSDVAMIERELGRFDACDASVARARELLEPLLRDYPDSRRYANQGCVLGETLALARARQGRFPEAIELFLHAVSERERLIERHPGDSDLVHLAAMVHNNLGSAYTDQRKRLDLARASFERALQYASAQPADVRRVERVRQMEHFVRYGLALTYCLENLCTEALPRIEAEDARAGGALELRYTADLWNEYILALRRAFPDEAVRAERENTARTRFYATLGHAIDAGFDNLAELTQNPALASFQNEPEFQALVQRLRAR